ncbi:MAG: RdgB/HAM1 family non-canonical purine NTP pyrophosphatase [Planctomycetota bacterium]|jgi:XTP/dITP diphosphohydrolase
MRAWLLLATTNPHKLDEVRAILEPLGLRVMGLDALPAPPEEPVEDGETFADNARIKATYYARASGTRCLADDSGLVVDALDGAPGVHSARYAGIGATRDERDRANNEKLLAALAGVPDEERTARFVCAMCLADPDGTVLAETEGTFEGRITDDPRGRHGFGYDPLLYVPDAGCTSAELEPRDKNRRSHRGEAARAMAERLATVG